MRRQLAAHSALPRLRWGVAGYGDVVRRRGLPGLAELGQHVACLWGRDRSRAAALAAGHGVPRATSRLAELLDGIDALYVATPAALHVPIALAALRGGVSVLVEKPLAGALDYDRPALADAVAAADAAGAVSAVAYYRRTSAAALTVRALLRPGPYRATVLFRAPFAPGPSDPMRWRTMAPVSGGGVLADAGSHRIDLLCSLFGPPERASGELADPFPGGAERRARVRLRWAGGSTATLRCEWSDGPPADRLTLAGPGHLLVLPRLDSGEVIEHNGVRTRSVLPVPRNPLLPVLADFLRAVDGGGAPACPLAQAAVVDDVIRAARMTTAWPDRRPDEGS